MNSISIAKNILSPFSATILATALLLSGISAHACPDLNGKFRCGIGIPGATMDIDVSSASQGGATVYNVLGYTIIANGAEQKPDFDIVLRGNTFQNVIYTGTCAGKALVFQAKGRNATKGYDGVASGTVQFTNRGQLSIQVQARWNGRSIKSAAICTPRK